MKQLITSDMGKVHLLFFIMRLASLGVYAQEGKWQVSDEFTKLNNPVELNPKNVALGKNIFVNTCVSCHGSKADGKGLITSTSFLTDTFQNQADGIIFAKISTGRDKMPPFKGTLKDEQIWSIIRYLRVLVNPSLMPPAKDLTIEIIANNDRKTITAFVKTADSLKQPIPEIDVHFYIKRDYGLMRFGQISNNTRSDGKVTAIFPDKIIGDLNGNVSIIAKVENNFLFNDASASTDQAWGQALKTEDEKFNQRTLWGSRDKTPVWLLLLANGIIIAVWGVIIYIIFNLFRIKKAGKIFIK